MTSAYLVKASVITKMCLLACDETLSGPKNQHELFDLADRRGVKGAVAQGMAFLFFVIGIVGMIECDL